MKFRSIATAVLFLSLPSLVCAELMARLAFGLGTPPLFINHPTIEYMFAPVQEVNRFGNRILVNELAMRSSSVESWHDRARVLVLGDSVVNGGALTDHTSLATTLLTDDSTVYGNVSAASWGPENLTAWIEEFGLLEAEKVIAVISSHDLTDIPSFGPLDPNTHPLNNPPLALIEAFQRYIPRYLTFLTPTKPQEVTQSLPSKNRAHFDEGLSAVDELFSILAENEAPTCIVLHPTITEIRDGYSWERPYLAEAISRRGIPMKLFESFLVGPPSKYYRDEIHLTDAGQAALASAILACSDVASMPID